MKAILMSIKPQHVANILNELKTIEIRKKFPKRYVGWVYIYCTKGNKKERLIADLQPDKVYHPLTEALHRGVYSIVDEDLIWNDCKKNILNGKVVARFWCDKVDKFYYNENLDYYTDINDKGLPMKTILEKSCLEDIDFVAYLNFGDGYAIHITNLEIFDKPKEIGEFHKPSWAEIRYKTIREEKAKQYRLSSAPQSWCYVEI